jgi:CSLREA domain-containing protein
MKTKQKTIHLFIAFAMLTMMFGLASPARAADTWTVNSLNDPGDGTCDASECTLREAVAAAGVGDTIHISANGTIPLASQIDITIPLSIVGPGAANLTLSGSNAVRVLNVNSPSAPINISGLTIANGYISGTAVNDGAGLYNLGMLTLDGVLVQSNTSTGVNGGGGIYNGSKATLTITNSTFSVNASPNRGGAIANYGSLTVTNSTFSGNIASNGSGGGIFTFGTLNVNNSTFSGNSSTANGSGIYNGIATLTLRNSIVANGFGSAIDCYNGAFTKVPITAGNLIESNGAGLYACGTPAVSGDPMLTPLANHGGSTPTFGLQSTSPALNAADDSTCASADQRGTSRPQGTHCDAGSFDALAPPNVTVEQAIGQADPTTVSPIHFTVTFDQAVSEFTNSDIVLTGTAGATTASISGVGPLYDVAVSGMTSSGTVIASIDADAANNSDGIGNYASSSNDHTVSYQNGNPPQVQSIVRANANPNSSASVNFTVTFDQSVTGVDTGDFALVVSGLTGASVASVSGSGATYTVNVNSGLGNGTLHLNLLDDDSIVNTSSQPLGGAGVGNGNFLGGETYNINKLLTYTSTAAQDGWILELSENSGAGGAINSAATTIRVGDDSTRKQYRGLLSFGTASLPDTAVVVAANLRIKMQSVSGPGDPFALFGGMVLDIRNGFFGTLAALQTGDFQFAASASQPPLSPTPSAGWYTFPLDPGLLPYINRLAASGGVTQLRLRFFLDDNNDAQANFISFYSGDTLTAADRPVLEVYYYLP